jgi:hypothetical protein
LRFGVWHLRDLAGGRIDANVREYKSVIVYIQAFLNKPLHVRESCAMAVCKILRSVVNAAGLKRLRAIQ